MIVIAIPFTSPLKCVGHCKANVHLCATLCVGQCLANMHLRATLCRTMSSKHASLCNMCWTCPANMHLIKLTNTIAADEKLHLPRFSDVCAHDTIMCLSHLNISFELFIDIVYNKVPKVRCSICACHAHYVLPWLHSEWP